MIEPDQLLDLAREGVERALGLGADEVEIFATALRSTDVELQKDDLHTVASEDETTFGVRVLAHRALGFATVNGPDHLAEACADALALARATPADPQNALPDPRPVAAFERAPDPGILGLGVEALVDLAAGMLEGVRASDARVRIDSGSLGAHVLSRAIATSRGLALCDASAGAHANLFGMAVDGEDVGSFDYDSASVLQAASLPEAVSALERRFVGKCVGALGARKAESFRGTLILTPEVVRSFLLGDLLPVLSAKSVRSGRSPLASRVGTAVAVPALTLVDDGRLPEGTASAAFDREGMPMGRRPLIEAGILRGFLYDAYEAHVAGVEPSGNARGGASSAPVIGSSNLCIEAGDVPYTRMCSEPERAVLVTRLSASSSPITGEFSGVVKGGFLLRRGERIPIRETLVAGNLYDLLHSVSGISKERTWLSGSAHLPALRVEDVSVTAG